MAERRAAEPNSAGWLERIYHAANQVQSIGAKRKTALCSRSTKSCSCLKSGRQDTVRTLYRRRPRLETWAAISRQSSPERRITLSVMNGCSTLMRLFEQLVIESIIHLEVGDFVFVEDLAVPPRRY